MAQDNDSKRLTLRLSPEARASIDEIIALGGASTAAEAVRRAIGTELFLLRERRKESTLLLRDREGNYKEIVLR